MRIQVAIPAAQSFARPKQSHFLAAVGATLRAWRARDRARRELANMDERERNDLPFARNADLRSEIAKPFWRD